MKKIIKRVVDASERLLFGATAEEAVQRRIALIDQRVEAAFARMVDALDQSDEASDNTSGRRPDECEPE